MKTLKTIITLGAMLALIVPDVLFGFAYRLPTQSAKGLAKGNAVITELNEPHAVYYNPAATAFSKGLQSTVGSYYVTTRTEHELKPFVDEESKRKDAFVPDMFTTWNMAPVNLENVTLGFGVSAPYGLAMVYQPESPIAPIVEKARLKMANYTVTGAVKLNEKLALGSGVDIAYSDGELQRVVDFGALVGASRALDGFAEFKGTDTSVGFNSSLLFLPAENHSIALTLRSQQTSRLDGEIRVRTPEALGGTLITGDGHARLKYPMILQGGYGYQWGKLKLEAVLDWTRWETVNALTIKSTSNPLIPDTEYRGEFDSVFTYNASATYAVCPGLDMHFGFIWTETPIPANTFNAIVPDSDRFALSTGLSFKYKDAQLDAAFQWVHFEGRSIDNAVGAPLASVDGVYSTDAFLVGLNATIRIW